MAGQIIFWRMLPLVDTSRGTQDDAFDANEYRRDVFVYLVLGPETKYYTIEEHDETAAYLIMDG